MGKYDPLGAYLKGCTTDEVPMTFNEIERIIGGPLPESQKFAAWWSNNPSNNVMTRVWLAAGYRTERVDLAGERLVFRKVEPRLDSRTWPTAAPPEASGVAEANAPTLAPAKPKRSGPHPGWGALAETVIIPEGVDLTAPVFSREAPYPGWGALTGTFTIPEGVDLAEPLEERWYAEDE
ncbi:MAG: DUF7662 domain-containing protein [Caulobacteraceae bacterium]